MFRVNSRKSLVRLHWLLGIHSARFRWSILLSLSRVADIFREKISLGERQKNGLSYQNAFSGTDSVDLIANIIRTNDRNLALLLGRALECSEVLPRCHV